MKNLKVFLIALIAGAVAGTFYDSIHAYYEVLYYTHPHFWKMSALVPLEFGLGAVMFILNLKMLPKITGKIATPTFGQVALSALLLLISYVITGIYVGQNLLTLGLLVPFALITLYHHKNKYQLFWIGILTLIGPLLEVLISSTGFFYYNFGNPIIPYWLPVLWTVAAGLFLDFGVYLLRKQPL